MKRINSLVVIMLLGVFLAQGSFSQQSLRLSDLQTDEATGFKQMLIQFDDQQNKLDPNTKGWKPLARYMEFNRSRLTSLGELPETSVFFEALQAVQQEKKAQSSLKNGVAWSPVGPIERPESMSAAPSHGMGRINCISFHPTDPNTYWVGVAQGGVWKTTDGGETYMPLTDDLPIMRVSDIAVNPNNPDNLFLSVCDYAYIGVALNTDGRKRHTHYGIGVYRTDDGGVTWQPTGLTYEQNGLDATLIRRVLIDSDQSGVLLAGGVSGLFRSTDDGVTWTQVRDEVIWDLEQDFNDPKTVYVTTGRVRQVSGDDPMMLKTTDFGLTWNEMPIGFPAGDAVGRSEIGLTPETSDYIYVVSSDPDGGFYALYRSTDAGATWEVRNSYADERVNILHWYQGTGSGGQGWYDLAILVDPRDRERVFVGGINMWGSQNGGQTWSPCSYWVMYNGFTLHADQHQYKYNPLDNKYYACHDGGVARTSEIILGSWNNDYNWPTVWEERSNGMIITSFYRIGLSEMFPGYMIGGAQDNSTFYNRNGNWTNFIGGDGMDCMIHPDDPMVVWGSSQYGNLVRSDDGGNNFRGIRPTNSEDGGWTTPMVMDPNNPNTIFTGYGNVYRSTNKGNSWTKLSNFPIISGFGKPAIISALAIYPQDPNTIYAAKRMHIPHIATSSVWKTHDASHWENITEGLPDELYFTSLTVDDDNQNHVWVACGGFMEGSKVFESTDGGANWINVSHNLPNIPVNVVVHQNGSENDIVYIGTDAGVYYKVNGESAWTLYSTELPNVIISDLEIHYPSRKLYAATFGRGFWMVDLVEPVSTTDPDMYGETTLRTYPNPASDRLLVDMTGILAESVTMELITITGKRVRLMNRAVLNGELHYSLVINDLPAGAYFLRVWAGKEMRSTRVIKQ